MSNRALRIIIADPDRSRLIQIEKTLNNCNYFRVLPVQSIDDLWALDHRPLEPFDLIIANIGMTDCTGADSNAFWKATSSVSHILIFDSKSNFPFDDSITTLMARIDPPTSSSAS